MDNVRAIFHEVDRSGAGGCCCGCQGNGFWKGSDFFRKIGFFCGGNAA